MGARRAAVVGERIEARGERGARRSHPVVVGVRQADGKDRRGAGADADPVVAAARQHRRAADQVVRRVRGRAAVHVAGDDRVRERRRVGVPAEVERAARLRRRVVVRVGEVAGERRVPDPRYDAGVLRRQAEGDRAARAGRLVGAERTLLEIQGRADRVRNPDRAAVRLRRRVQVGVRHPVADEERAPDLQHLRAVVVDRRPAAARGAGDQVAVELQILQKRRVRYLHDRHRGTGEEGDVVAEAGLGDDERRGLDHQEGAAHAVEERAVVGDRAFAAGERHSDEVEAGGLEAPVEDQQARRPGAERDRQGVHARAVDPDPALEDDRRAEERDRRAGRQRKRHVGIDDAFARSRAARRLRVDGQRGFAQRAGAVVGDDVRRRVDHDRRRQARERSPGAADRSDNSDGADDSEERDGSETDPGEGRRPPSCCPTHRALLSWEGGRNGFEG